jgi:hypothetical protein
VLDRYSIAIREQTRAALRRQSAYVDEQRKAAIPRRRAHHEGKVTADHGHTYGTHCTHEPIFDRAGA